MRSTAIQTQIQNLELQVQLQESNYRYAIELKKDCNVLRRMRYNIKALKELLQSLKEFAAKQARHNLPPGNFIVKHTNRKNAGGFGSPPLRKSDHN